MDLECNAGISKIAIKATEEDGIVSRIVRMTLVREFDSLVASAIGGDASSLRDSLSDHSCSKVEIPIDLLAGECRLVGEMGDDVTIKLVTGVKAIGKAPGKDDEGPTIELVFDFPLQIKAWDFFGRNVGGRASLTFTKVQLELPGTAPAAANGTNGTKAHAAGPAVVEAIDRLKAAVPNGTRLSIVAGGKSVVIADKRSAEEIARDDEQAAETPEEAEAIREERIAREHAESLPAPSAFVVARYGAIEGDIVVTHREDVGAWVARYETPLAVMEADGDTEEEARAALRARLFAKFAEDEAKLAGGSPAPKTGLRAPPKNGKGKTKGDDAPPAAPAGNGAKPKEPAPEGDGGGAAPLDDGPTCVPGCQVAHVHSFAEGEDGLQF